MTQTRHEFQPIVPGAFRGGLSRTEFYDGMILGEADLKREQSYWQMKRRLTNRALGQGVVWGLSAQWNSKTRAFTLCPGYGLSCCGDDLIVECTETVPEGALVDICAEDFREILKSAQGPCPDPGDTRPDGPVEAALMLEYVECPSLPRPAFEDPCASPSAGCRFSATRETTRLRLVPPPRPAPGPLDWFCEQVEALRAMLAEAGLDAPKAAQAGAVGTVCPVWVSLAQEAAGQALNAMTRDVLPGRDNAQVTLALDGAGTGALVLSLVPPLGYGFLRSWETDAQGQRLHEQTIETLMELSFRESDLTAGTQMSRRFGVEMAPLAGGQSHEITYAITARRVGSRVEADFSVVSVTARRTMPDCASLLKDWARGCAPLCATRTLLLAAVWGWFRGLVSPAGCALPGKDDPDPDPTRAAIGWMAGWLAWKILFRIDIADPAAAGAQRCLQKLFQAWCAGFNYKGPRCDCHQHGILLGAVTLSRRGEILCFDEWKYRRYVLTGPLLGHWAGLFGLPPLDALATRLAGWVCCVARAPLVAIDAAAAKAIRDQLLTAEGELRVGGHERLDLQKLLSGGLLQGAPDLPDPSASSKPKTLGAAHPFRTIEARLDSAPVMVRAPVLELVRDMAPHLALADLKPVGEEAAFDAVVTALDAEGVATAEALLALDPDLAAKRLRADLLGGAVIEDTAAADRAVGQVFTAAQRALEAASAAVVAEAESRPDDELFTRADLRQTATLAAIRKAVNVHLRGAGLSAARVRGIATQIAERG